MSQKFKKKGSLILSFLAFSLLLFLVTLLFWGILFFVSERENVDADSLSGKTVTVILDPGHGGEDGGAVGANNVYEKDLNLAIAKDVESYLKMNGISVMCTRDRDILLYDKTVDYKGRKKMLDLAARLKISRETENSIFVSIHMNSFPKAQYSGLQVYYSPNDPSSADLALLIQNDTRSFLQPTNSRKIKAATSGIYLLDRITTPAVLVECGFLSNTAECALLSDEKYRQRLSLVLANAVAEFVNLQTNPR